MPDYRIAETVMRKHLTELMAYPNVVSVGIGYRQSGSEETDELCISVSVEKKLPPGELPPGALLPTSLEGVSVDVIETGRMEAL